MEAKGAYQIIKAKTPLAELDRYTTTLRSITQGRANFSTSFADYAPVPYDIQQSLMASYSEQAEEVHS
jgi:elongation factor G